MPRTHNVKRTVSSINGVRKTKYPHRKERNWTLILHYTYKSTQTEDINTRPETIKLPEENIGEKLPETGLRNDFSNKTQKLKQLKQK